MDVVEERIEALERLVYGSNLEHDEDKTNGRIIDNLVHINNQLTTKVSKHDKIKQTLAKIGTIQKLTDPSNAPHLTLSAEQKMQLIKASEQEIRNRAYLLQEVERTRIALDSEHIRKAPALFPKLAELGTIQAGQLNEANSMKGEVSELVIAYNQLVTSLAHQFAFWDHTLTQLETKEAST